MFCKKENNIFNIKMGRSTVLYCTSVSIPWLSGNNRLLPAPMGQVNGGVFTKFDFQIEPKIFFELSWCFTMIGLRRNRIHISSFLHNWMNGPNKPVFFLARLSNLLLYNTPAYWAHSKVTNKMKCCECEYGPIYLPNRGGQKSIICTVRKY